MTFSRHKLATALSLVAALVVGCGPSLAPPAIAPVAFQGPISSYVAPQARKIDWQILNGKVTQLLPDDLIGSRHQHFLVAVTPKQVVKVAHNIDLAPYVPVKVGDTVELKGEYIKKEPQERDVIHWTHYNPRGGEGGYIRFAGRLYDRL